MGLAAVAAADDLDAIIKRYRTALKTAPPDVAAWMGRHFMCWHWGGEEPYNAERRAEIQKGVEEAKCDTIDAEEKALRRKHAGSPPALAAIDAAAALK